MISRLGAWLAQHGKRIIGWDEILLGGPLVEATHDEIRLQAPLTAITAWEMLFDRLDIRKPVPGAANVDMAMIDAPSRKARRPSLKSAMTLPRNDDLILSSALRTLPSGVVAGWAGRA